MKFHLLIIGDPLIIGLFYLIKKLLTLFSFFLSSRFYYNSLMLIILLLYRADFEVSHELSIRS